MEIAHAADWQYFVSLVRTATEFIPPFLDMDRKTNHTGNAFETQCRHPPGHQNLLSGLPAVGEDEEGSCALQ
jgi:hypothetical protein